jgi:hypothetical protein
MIERATDFGRVKRMTSSLPDLQQAGRFCTKLQAILYNPGDRRPDILTVAMHPILLENAELNASEPALNARLTLTKRQGLADSVASRL